MSLIPLPIRLAAASSKQEEISSIPEEPVPFGPGLDLPLGGAPPPPLIPSPLIAENGDSVSNGQSGDPLPPGAPSELRIDAAAGSTNHQFWLKDAKIAEDLFTIHRSAKHLVEFTSSMIGSHDPSLSYRPIPVMSDADVLFMTQLSNDIARGVGGISAVRHHGMRTRKRKARDALAGAGGAVEPSLAKEHSSHQRHSKGSRDDRTSGSKRLQVSKDGDELSCQKCGRTETPEWRKGPDGLLCNVCGLMYAKQRRKLKGR